MLGASSLAATGHRRQKNDGGAVAHRRLQLVQRADVLAVHVNVRVAELPLELGEPRRQVVEDFGDRPSGSRNLAGAAGLLAERRWDANCRHTCAPWQNST